jgi:opacity protein-like surface antigen
MRHAAALTVLLLLACTPALAQSRKERIARYIGSRTEVSGGYSYFSFAQTTTERLNMNGWQASVDYRVKSWLYAVAEVDGEYSRQSSIYPTQNGISTQLYPYMAGPRIYPLKRDRKHAIFVEGLIGKAHGIIYTPAIPPLPPQNDTNSAMAWAGGAGMDYRLSKRFLIRAEGDYVSTDVFGTTARSNGRGTVSFVYQFGTK